MGNTLRAKSTTQLKPKEMLLEQSTPEVSAQASQGRLELTIRSPYLIKDLFIESPWQGAQYSDNFCDILPNRSYTIVITHPDITAPNDTKGAEAHEPQRHP